MARKLREGLDEDFQASSEVPPTPPEWVRAVEAVAGIPTGGDPFVGRILTDIQKTLTNAYSSAIREYRAVSAKRHQLLAKMLPCWRGLERELNSVVLLRTTLLPISHRLLTSSALDVTSEIALAVPAEHVRLAEQIVRSEPAVIDADVYT